MRYSKVRDVKSPERGTAKSAGIDFFIPNDFIETTLYPNDDLLIPSGIKAEIPEGYMLMAADKSGIATSKGALINAGKQPKSTSLNASLIVGAKIVDEDYQGEIGLHIINVGGKPVILSPGMKIVQFILVPVFYDTLEEVPINELYAEVSERGNGGWGSTNNNEK